MSDNGLNRGTKRTVEGSRINLNPFLDTEAIMMETLQSMPANDMYSKDCHAASKAGLDELSRLGFQQRLLSLADHSKTGIFCSSKENPSRPTKCTCLHSFLELKENQDVHLKQLYHDQLDTMLKLYKAVTCVVANYRQQEWKRWKVKNLKQTYTDMERGEVEQEKFYKIKGNKKTLPVSLQETLMQLMAYYANFHYGGIIGPKNTRTPRIAYSFGVYDGKGNPPQLFCSNTFLSKILGELVPSITTFNYMLLLNRIPSYRKKLVNASVRTSYINLYISGHFDEVKSDNSKDTQIAHTRLLMKALLQCPVATKQELIQAVQKVIALYVPSCEDLRKTVVLRCRENFEIGSVMGVTRNGISVCSRPDIVQRDCISRLLLCNESNEMKELIHPINGYIANLRMFLPFFEHLCQMKLSEPGITGNQVNSNHWLRYVSSQGSKDGPVQLVHKIAKGKNHVETFHGPDNISIQDSELEKSPILRNTIELARDFHSNGVLPILEHIASREGLLQSGSWLADDYDIDIDMGMLWTKLHLQQHINEELRSNTHNNKNSLAAMQEVASGYTRERLFQAIHTDIKAEILYSHQNARNSEGATGGDHFWLMFLGLVKEGMTLEFLSSETNGKRLLLEIPFGHMLLVPSTLLHAGGFCTSLNGNLRGHMHADLRRKNSGQKRRDVLGSVPRSGLYSVGNDYLHGDYCERKRKDKTVYGTEDKDYVGSAVEIFDKLFTL